MKKRISLFVVIVMLLQILVACSSATPVAKTDTPVAANPQTVEPTANQTEAQPTIDQSKNPQFNGEKVTVVTESPSAFAYWQAEAPKIKELFGIELDLQAVPYESLYENLVTELAGGATTGYDVVTFPPRYNGDFMGGDFLEPLDKYIAQYSIDADDIMPRFRDLYMKWNGVTYAVPIDGDIFVLYYRTDLFENADEKASFKAKYGYELVPPKTWDEYKDVAEFFTRKAGDTLAGKTLSEPFFGTAEEYRVPDMFYLWLARFGSLGGQYFDADMNPQINNEAGITALKEYIDVLKFNPEGAINSGWTEVNGELLQGQVAMGIHWTDEAKSQNDPSQSKVVGLLGDALMPGSKNADGSITVASPMAYGRVLAIPKTSQHKDAAFQVIRYITSKDVSLLEVSSSATGLDPFRLSHLERLSEWVTQWPGLAQHAEVDKANLAVGYPELTLPGTLQYLEAASREFSRAANGEITAEVALANVETQWQTITDQIGRENQIKLWKAIMQGWKNAGLIK